MGSGLPAVYAVGPALWSALSGAGIGVGLTLLALLPTFPFEPLPADAPWADRARETWPARRAVVLAAVLAPLVAGSAWAIGAGVTVVPSSALVSLAALGAVGGALLAREPLRRRVGAPASPLRGLRDGFVLFWLLRPGALLAALVFLAGHPTLDRWSGVVAVAGAAALVGVLRGDHVDLLRPVGITRPAGGRVRDAVAAVVAAAGTGPVEVDEVDAGFANAAAYPVGRRIWVSRALVEEVDDAGLRAVVAHELAHLDEPRRVRLSRVAASFAGIVPLFFVRPLLTEAAPVLLGVLLTGLVVRGILGRQARAMEIRADAEAARDDAGAAYNRALEAIYRRNGVPAVTGGSTGAHPDLYDRLVAAGVPPTWPRPAPPSAWRLRFAAGLVVFGAVPAALVPALPHLVGVVDPEAGPRWRLATGLGGVEDLDTLALDAFEGGDHAGAARLYAAAAARAPTSPWEPANLAIVLAAGGWCDEAARAAREARARIGESGPEAQVGADGRVHDLRSLFSSVDRAVAICYGARAGGAIPADASPAAGPP